MMVRQRARFFVLSPLLTFAAVSLIAGCPASPMGGGTTPPACDAEQICRDLSRTDQPIEDLSLLEGALTYCERLADGSMTPTELCGFCDDATGTSADEISFCQDPVEQIVADEFDYVAELAEIRANVVDGDCAESASYDSAVVGNCDKQTAFLLLNWVVEGERLRTSHYYDRKTGELLGIARESTVSMPPCCGRFLWPSDLHCANPSVVEAVCGSSLRPGASIDVP